MKLQANKFRILLALLILVSGCSLLARRQLAERFGEESPRQRIVPAVVVSDHSVRYTRDVKPIIDSRCVVCHSCFDSPCQFNVGSAEGLDRGASKQRIYADRILAAEPTRLFVDAHSTAEWRQKGFFPMFNERLQTPEANRASSVLYRSLKLKERYPQPSTAKLPDSFDLSLSWGSVCPSAEEMDEFESSYPLWGMPYAFPGLSKEEQKTFLSWLELGALVEEPQAPSRQFQRAIAEWEEFLNGDSKKQQLVSRYIYEHLFLGGLYFPELGRRHYFNLVRSLTPPGEELKEISTTRPIDDPRTSRVYYRLKLRPETVVAKTFMPYALSAARLKRIKELFISPQYEVTELPSYEVKVATNPFKTFEQIPAKNRYQFLLDEAEYFIMGFIKGPVCRGDTALNVINDQFWVFFVDPDEDPTINVPGFLEAQKHHLALPAGEGSSTLGITRWHAYAEKEKRYIQAKRDLLKKVRQTGKSPQEQRIWDGDSSNTNAALTVFRHHDSATVVRGLVGDDPKTAWLFGYPLFERIHYLLVADFDVFGGVGHQLLTRLYMDFMRVEGENNFLLFLPTAERKREHDYWYRGIGGSAEDFALEYAFSNESYDWTETGIKFTSSSPKQELFSRFRNRIGKAVDTTYSLKSSDPEELRSLSNLRGSPVSFMPEASLLRVRKGGQSKLYSLIHNRAHLNVAVLYLESLRLSPAEDTLTVVPGVLGAHPNMIFDVDIKDLTEFVAQVGKLSAEKDYSALLDRFGIRRTNPSFWQHSDWVHQEQTRLHGFDPGRLDLSRYENR